jgi:hypothetical protein
VLPLAAIVVFGAALVVAVALFEPMSKPPEDCDEPIVVGVVDADPLLHVCDPFKRPSDK